MSSPSVESFMSAEAFQALPESGMDQELIRGEIHQMSKNGPRHADLSGELLMRLRQFVKEHGGGKALAECGFILERNPDTLRAPDLAVLGQRESDLAKQSNPTDVPPRIAVEVNSPNDVASDVTDKARWWLAHGVEQVWVVDDPTRTITVYYPDGAARVLGETQTLDAGNALPGFTLSLHDLFAV